MAWHESSGVLHLPPDVSLCCVEAAGPDLRRAFGIEASPPSAATCRRRSRGAAAPRRLSSAWVKQLAAYNGLPPPQFLFRSGGPRLDEHHVCSLLIGGERFQGRHTSFFKAREAAAEQALRHSRLPRPSLTLPDLMAGLRWWAGVKPAWADEDQEETVAETEAEAEWPGPPCSDPPRFGLPRLPQLAGVRPLDLPAISAIFPRDFAPLPPAEPEHVPLHDPRIDPDDPSVRGCHGYADVVKYVPGLLDAIRSPAPPPPEVSFPPTGRVPPQLVGYAGSLKVLPDGLADILKDPRSPLDHLMRARPSREPPLSWRLYAWFWHGVCFRHDPAVQREALRREARARKMAATVWSPQSNARALPSFGGFGRAEAELEVEEEEEEEEEKENDRSRMEEEEEEAPRCMALGRRELCPHGGGEKAVLVGDVSRAARRLESDRWAALKLAKAERRAERTRAARRELEPFGGRPESCPLGAGPLAIRAREAAGREWRARRLMSNSRLFDDHRPSIPVRPGELEPFGGGAKVWPQPQFYPTGVLQQQIRWAEAWRLRGDVDEASAPRLQRPDALDLRFPPSLPVELEWQLRFGKPRDGVDSGALFVRLSGVSAAELEDLLPSMIAKAASGPPLPPPPEEPLEDVAEEEEGDLRVALRGLWRRRQVSGSSCGAPSEEAEDENEPGDLVRRTSSDRRRRLRRPKIGAVVAENGRQLLLFRVGDSVFASEAHCPHLRAPLQDADIESLAEGDCVLRCTRHRFAFNLSRGGRIVWPPHRHDLRLQTYPVRTDEAGHVYVAFPNTNPDLFHPGKRKVNIEFEEDPK